MAYVNAVFVTEGCVFMAEPHKPPLWLSAAIFIMLAVLIAASVRIWETDIHIILIICAVAAAAIGVFFLKNDYSAVERGLIDGIMTAMQACLILYTVGTLIGTWIIAGVVPSMIYYGLMILRPSVFLFAALVICTIASLATGSSWGTSGTVGIALMGIAAGLGIPAPLTAGIIISGAYCGDKMSPLSDTTNLAPAVSGTDIFQHVRAMCWTTLPTYAAVVVITLLLCVKYSGGSIDSGKITAMQSLMRAEFWIDPLALMPPLIVIFLSAVRKPALPSLWAGVIVAAGFAFFHGTGVREMLTIMQNGYTPTVSQTIADAAGNSAALSKLLAENNIAAAPEAVLQAAKDIIKLMQRGGLQSMNGTVSLIICALAFGSVMETCGFLEVILEALIKPIKSTAGLITATLVSCAACDLFLSDQYLSIAITGRMFKPVYDERGLHPRMLSRSLEDSGTLLSALVPWNTCGAYQAGVLGVPTLEYLPYAFLNYLNPIFAAVLTYMGIGIFWRGRDGEPVKGGKTRPPQLAEDVQ